MQVHLEEKQLKGPYSQDVIDPTEINSDQLNNSFTPFISTDHKVTAGTLESSLAHHTFAMPPTYAVRHGHYGQGRTTEGQQSPDKQAQQTGFT